MFTRVQRCSFDVFAVNTKLPIMAILASKDFYNGRKLPPMELDMVIT